MGSSLILDSGTGFYTALCLTDTGQNYVEITTNGANSQIQQGTPITFAVGDVIRWDVTYRCSA
jgi:hypothetical protein